MKFANEIFQRLQYELLKNFSGNGNGSFGVKTIYCTAKVRKLAEIVINILSIRIKKIVNKREK